MIDSIIKIAGNIPAGNTTTNDISSVDIPEDGYIWALHGLLYMTVPPATNAVEDIILLLAELSFLSTNQLGANDARGELIEVGLSCYTDSTANGTGQKVSENVVITLPKGIPVQAGERLHTHGHSNTTLVTGAFSFLLYLETKGGGRRATRGR